MSDQEEWAEEPAVPPKKKGLPGWLMFCGGGCLIAMILGAIGAYFAVGEVKKMMDPEFQWERLEESIAMDARPPELNMMFGSALGIDLWMIQDDRGFIAAIYDFREAKEEDREEIFGDDFKGGGVPGLSKIDDPVLGEVAVQGRVLPIQRFQNTGGFNPGAGAGGEGEKVPGQGAACFIDLTAEGSGSFQMLFLMRMDGSKTPIEDAVIQEFLKPFVIGPDHKTYVVPAGSSSPKKKLGDVDDEEFK